MPKLGLIFDLDGVLVETAPLHSAAWRQVALEMGVDPKHFDALDLRGVKRENCLELIFNDRSLSNELAVKILEEKNALYCNAVEASGESILTEEVRRLLNDLRKNGYKMAIASASRNAARILQITGLERLVDEVCDGRFTGPTKPAPDQFIEAARLLGREPEECVVFEDANVGVDGAWAAGSYIIGIGPAVKDRVELDYCLDTLSSVGFQRLHEIVSAFPQRETAVAA